jgi:hypothetical protein
MIKCTKCQIEKEDNEFATYWHSRQQKMRIRKICRGCISIQQKEYKKIYRERKKVQPVVQELQPEVLEVIEVIDTSIEKKCNTCEKVKPLEQYYKSAKCVGGKSNRCIECQIKKDRDERLEELIENGGSLRRYEEPNRYYDEFQKEATFNLLYAMGWSFNEDKGIWWKEGIKTEDGVFLNINEPKVKSYSDRHKKRNSVINKELQQKIYQLHLDGYLKIEIANMLNVSKISVYKYIKKYEKS